MVVIFKAQTENTLGKGEFTFLELSTRMHFD